MLDNSGSMAGQPIADLRTAAQNLVGVLFTGYEGTDKVKVGVVPFAAAVNVGPHYKTAAWMDTAGASPVHFENFAEPKTRFELLGQMGVAWGGCVEVRPSPHDVTDSLPTAGTPASLFVPMFNPDEPDPANAGGDSYGNNYLSDAGGTCPLPPAHVPALRASRGNCTAWSEPPPLPPAEAQARTCKYEGASIGSAQGPNYLCELQADPAAHHQQGFRHDHDPGPDRQGRHQHPGRLDVGLARAVARCSPSPRAAPTTTPRTPSIWSLMTDGENWHQAMSNHNKSSYHSFGYAVKGRLGTTYTTTALVNQMNTKTLAACTNAKAAGIKVYTVAFRLEDAATLAMLASCASGATYAYNASNGAALMQAFESIGARDCQAARCRLTQAGASPTASGVHLCTAIACGPSLPLPLRVSAQTGGHTTSLASCGHPGEKRNAHPVRASG